MRAPRLQCAFDLRQVSEPIVGPLHRIALGVTDGKLADVRWNAKTAQPGSHRSSAIVQRPVRQRSATGCGDARVEALLTPRPCGKSCPTALATWEHIFAVCTRNRAQD